MQELDDYNKAKNDLLKAFKIKESFEIEDGRSYVFYLKKSLKEIVWAKDREDFADGEYYTSEYIKIFKSGNFKAVLMDGYVSGEPYLKIFDCKNGLTSSEVDELWDTNYSV